MIPTKAFPTCPICSSNCVPHGSALALGRYRADYFRCLGCGFVRVQDPTWLAEAYSSAISVRDTGLVHRTARCQRVVQALLLGAYDCSAPFVDYGGGYGLFTRMMRDHGFAFEHHDPYCANLFAQGHEWDGTTRTSLLTAFEVAEHLPDPMQGFDTMLDFADDVLISTELMPFDNPRPGDWWYYDTQSGQHISFYTLRALQVIAERANRRLYTNGSNLHLISKRRLPRFILLWAEKRSCQLLTTRLMGHRRTTNSLLRQDSAELLTGGS